MINERPKVCNLCGGEVILVPNSFIYNGQSYGSGFCYLCTECGAYVGTHRKRPYDAMGILANKEMRQMKKKCHDIFDLKWKDKKRKHYSRDIAYQRLAKKMGISNEDCHFGYFDMEQLEKAYSILTNEGRKHEKSNPVY